MKNTSYCSAHVSLREEQVQQKPSVEEMRNPYMSFIESPPWDFLRFLWKYPKWSFYLFLIKKGFRKGCFPGNVVWRFRKSLRDCFYMLRWITAQEMKFSIKDLFSKCDQIRRKLRIWSHLLQKSWIENFIFCAVCVPLRDHSFSTYAKFFKKLTFLGPWYPYVRLHTRG